MFTKKMVAAVATAAKNAPSGGGSSRGFGGMIRRLIESPEFQAQLKKQTSGASSAGGESSSPAPQQAPIPAGIAKRMLESGMGGVPAARQGRGMGRFAGLAEMMKATPVRRKTAETPIVTGKLAGMKKGGVVKKKATVKAKPVMKAKARKK